MDNTKTFIFMIVLSAVFIFYVLFFSPNQKDEEVEYQKEVDSSKKELIVEKDSEVIKGRYDLLTIPQTKNYDLIYENENILVEFDPHDAVIRHAFIKDTFLEKSHNKSYDIVNAGKNDGALKIKMGSWENEMTLSSLTGGKNIYHYSRNGDVFTFTCKFKEKNKDTIYTIVKRYTFIGDENIFKLEVDLYNNKNISNTFDNSDFAYSIGWGPLLGIDSVNKTTSKRQKNVFAYLKNKKIKEINFNNVKKMNNKKLFATVNRYGDETWISSSGHYFASIIYPDNKNYNYFFDYRDKDNNNNYCGLSRNTNNSKINSTFYVYIGPKQDSVLKKYDNFYKDGFDLRGANFSKVRYKGWPLIGEIGDGIGFLLTLIYKLVRNYGLAIIILTILIKVILFPLTKKSMESQQKMSKLQPKMKELQAKYKDNPEALNRETMNLYKKEGINPLGGCLPMLLQMPILLAMYQLLNRMIELKGASFLWIRDLSQPDSVINFNFTIPLANISSLNILPILMAGVSVLSSLNMPDTQSNKQAKMMMWMMPLFFFFIFYNVSSGLVLYWTVMNILNLAQQIYLNKVKSKGLLKHKK